MMSKGFSIFTLLLVAGLAFWLGTRTQHDPNDLPTFGKTGLPTNCRSLVQMAVDGWKNKVYSASEAMASLERNCGADGQLWGYDPE